MADLTEAELEKRDVDFKGCYEAIAIIQMRGNKACTLKMIMRVEKARCNRTWGYIGQKER